ncbi:glycosyltransferase family 2 protein [Pedobacter aquatilis]|uniref:glycosyltransferase family 2 protein n=1 Tax=Pedobacter aquatilis TaxID=351343 RepID=UPI00292D01CD|nr:glycosyltransferase [Pedobacter aquatilis]
MVKVLKNHYSDVTLLVTHYNRSASLQRLLDSFVNNDVSFGAIVVSDDGSKEEHLEYIESLSQSYNITLVKTISNKGLGNNINKGQDAVKTDYTLYVQEDFIALGLFNETFSNAVDILKANSVIDTIRFYSYLNYPKLKAFGKGFAEMIFEHSSLNIDKIPMYSDHPHLRRKNFFDKFGRYQEGVKGDQTEYRMMLSFLKNKGRGLLHINYKSVFDQVNTNTEPSTMTRKTLTNSDNYFVQQALYIYRLFKFIYSYYIKPIK